MLRKAIVLLLSLYIFSATASLRNLRINSEVQARFAITEMKGTVENAEGAAREVSFTTQLPKDAYISNFTLETGGQLIVAEVREKDRARNIFEEAKRRGISAGHVLQETRDTHTFRVRVNIAPRSSLDFTLIYQEVLTRVHGVYKHAINVEPEETLDDITVEVVIAEWKRITRLHVPDLQPGLGMRTNEELLRLPTSREADTRQEEQSRGGSLAYVNLRRSRNSEKGRQLVVLYDVERSANGGELISVDGFFVHFIAPDGLVKDNKHVVFALDKSGSMQGEKDQQVEKALELMLKDMTPQDKFNVVTFNDKESQWMPQSQQATKDNIQRALDFVRKEQPRNLTNIHSALLSSLKILDSDGRREPMSSMLIFLTDGRPTAGRRDREFILRDVTERNPRAFSIHSVAFGPTADFELLRRISAQNKGLARRIYEDADADMQLAGFYAEISSPLLNDVQIRYLNPSVEVKSLVQNSAVQNTYFLGGEIVVAGRTSSASDRIQASVSGGSRSGQVYLSSEAAVPESRDQACFDRPSYQIPKCNYICINDDSSRNSRQSAIVQPSSGYSASSSAGGSWGAPAQTAVRSSFERDSPIVSRSAPLPANTVGGMMERMWAYMSIKKLLADAELSSAGSGEDLRKKALELSLKYNFVTELTSLVVTTEPSLLNFDPPASAQDGPTAYASNRGGSPSDPTLRVTFYQKDGSENAPSSPQSAPAPYNSRTNERIVAAPQTDTWGSQQSGGGTPQVGIRIVEISWSGALDENSRQVLNNLVSSRSVTQSPQTNWQTARTFRPQQNFRRREPEAASKLLRTFDGCDLDITLLLDRVPAPQEFYDIYHLAYTFIGEVARSEKILARVGLSLLEPNGQITRLHSLHDPQNQATIIDLINSAGWSDRGSRGDFSRLEREILDNGARKRQILLIVAGSERLGENFIRSANGLKNSGVEVLAAGSSSLASELIRITDNSHRVFTGANAQQIVNSIKC